MVQLEEDFHYWQMMNVDERRRKKMCMRECLYAGVIGRRCDCMRVCAVCVLFLFLLLRRRFFSFVLVCRRLIRA